MSDKLLIIIPTYNERENIEKLIMAVFNTMPDAHIFIIDDNSPDGTGTFIESLISANQADRLFLLKRSGKLGLGTAYVEGFKWALARDYTRVIQMDADFSHDPNYLPMLYSENADLVIGSRYVKGGGVRNWSRLREFISRSGSWYARQWLGMNVKDLTGGFKCWKRSLLEKINLNEIQSNGYCFQIEMNYAASLLDANIIEVPIIFVDRIKGQSKMSKKIALEAMWMVPKLKNYKTIGKK